MVITIRDHLCSFHSLHIGAAISAGYFLYTSQYILYQNTSPSHAQHVRTPTPPLMSAISNIQMSTFILQHLLSDLNTTAAMTSITGCADLKSGSIVSK